MPALRIWFVARHILDQNARGYVRVDDVQRIVKTDASYIRKVCRTSPFFRGVGDNKLYYISQNNMLTLLEMVINDSGWHRVEKIKKRYLKNFSSQTHFAGYVIKCFAERDLVKGRRRTHGRISHARIATEFSISEKTVRNLLKTANAKTYRNVKTYPQADITNGISSWLLANMDKTIVIDGISINVEKYAKAFFVQKHKNNKKILAIRLPNIYKFTGLSRVIRKPFQGQRQ